MTQHVPERFVPLLGGDFKVCCELQLGEPLVSAYKGEMRAIVQRLAQEEVVSENSVIIGDKTGQLFLLPDAHSVVTKERLVSGVPHRLIFPRLTVCVDGEVVPIAEKASLVFRRKFDYKLGVPRLWMLAARHGEPAYFNAFSSVRASTGNQEYVKLLVESVSLKDFQGFTPLFIKTKIGGEYLYFMISAKVALKEISVLMQKVEEHEAPDTLHKAVSAR